MCMIKSLHLISREGRNVMLFRRPNPPKDKALQEAVYINEYEIEKYKERKQ